MKPTLQDIKFDITLSNISIAYKNADYIADRILPIVPSKKVNGKYYKYGKEKFRKVHSLRGIGASAREVDYGLSKSTEFVCKDHALKQIVPRELVDQAPQPLTPNIDAAENVTERLMVEKEYDLATYMKSETNLTNYVELTGNDQWSDYANSDPIDDIKTGRTTVHGKIFKNPNVLVLGQEVYDKLVDHPDIVDRIKYSQLGVGTPELMARIFNVKEVIVAGAGYESADEGADSSMAYIWGKYAWLLYVTPRPGIKSLSFGYHFQFGNRKVDKWWDNDREATWVRAHDYYTREIVTVDAAYLIQTAVA